MSEQAPFWTALLEGTSVEGRALTLYVSHEDRVLDTLILSLFHGDEAEAGTLVNSFLALGSPDEWGGHCVGVVPVVNPDGLQRQQRKNANGVDLNRNFPTQAWEMTGKGTEYYSGSEAASEPETQFVLDILTQHPPKQILSLHTPYRVINYDGPAQVLAQAMATINGYEVTADIGYPTPGSFGTYVGKERHIPTITLELPEKEAYTEKEHHANLQALCHVIGFQP